MRPEILKLQNFGPFADAEINFNQLDDIFLVTGKTGSGKTTVFDAICFALYGKVPGSRGEYLTRLRSDYAEESTECSVSLDFSIGEKRCRVERSPKQEKPKKRGAGTTIIEESAVLYEIESGMPVHPTSKKSEADSKIRDLIGLEHNEFFKIVLLPQGEFAEFLKQNSTARQQVLGKLFPMERVLAVQNLAKEKAKNAEAEVKEAGRALEEISKRFSIGDYASLHDRVEENLKIADSTLIAITKETANLQAVCAVLDSERKALDQIEAVKEEQKKNDEEKNSIEELEKKISRSRQAQPLRPQLVLAEEAEKNSTAAEDEYGKLVEIKTQAEQINEQAAREADAVPGIEKESQDLRERKPRLEEMIAEEEKLLYDGKEQKRLQAHIADLVKKKKTSEESLSAKERETAKVQKQAEGLEQIERLLEIERQVKDDLVQLKKIAAEGNDIENEGKKISADFAAYEELMRHIKKNIPLLQEEIQRFKLEKETKEKADMASHLAGGLKPGEPCPVCGSTQHPLPAAASAPVYGITEKIESREKALKEAELEFAKLHEKNESNQAMLNRQFKRKQELLKARRELFTLLQGDNSAGRAEAADNNGTDSKTFAPALISGSQTIIKILNLPQNEFPSNEEASKLLEEQSARLTVVTREHKEIKNEAGRIPKLFQDQSQIRLELSKIESELSGCTERERILSASIAERQTKINTMLKELETACGPDIAAGTAGTKDALAVIERRLAQLEKKLDELQTKRGKASLALASAAAKEEASAQKLNEAAQKARGAKSALNEALSLSPFPDVQSLKEAILDRQAEQNMEAAVFRWKDERTRLDSACSEAERSLAAVQKEKSGFDDTRSADELKKRMKDLEIETEKTQRNRDRLISEKAGLEKDKAAFEEASARFETLRQKTEKLTMLADDLRGNNPKKKAFDAWLLARYLSEVAVYASKRLERMSESRYSLLLDTGGESTRGRQGLDLAVFDAYTGKTRPCATLSGGESFMASISLALGLADSIQARSGGVRLDAVFIDEGFGSLDEASLDKALTILDELRDHRMVGLISHVAEMKSRIPCRIEIEKSGSGSRIRIDGGKS
ncbi:MAG: AAA family ATPase [Treponema sp.]|jgi:exonuclease SbcC|nr:AAA family ATPase [Treponema sp.]